MHVEVRIAHFNAVFGVRLRHRLHYIVIEVPVVVGFAPEAHGVFDDGVFVGADAHEGSRFGEDLRKFFYRLSYRELDRFDRAVVARGEHEVDAALILVGVVHDL